MDEPIPELAPGVARSTVTDALEMLRARGYVADLELVEDQLVSVGGEQHAGSTRRWSSTSIGSKAPADLSRRFH
jgi:hypothetical protein